MPRIVVTVSRNGVRSSAVTTSAPSTSYAHPPCWYFPSWEGPELFDYYDSGQANRDARHYDDGQRWDPPAGYQDHRNDGLDKGQWWSGMCSSEYWPDESIRAFMDYAEQWFDGHPTIWVAAGEPNPNAAALVIPPEVLVHIAEDFLTLPAPTLAHNPTGNSVVNLPTWVWATDESFAEQRVRAQFGANWAEVIARPAQRAGDRRQAGAGHGRPQGTQSNDDRGRGGSRMTTASSVERRSEHPSGRLERTLIDAETLEERSRFRAVPNAPVRGMAYVPGGRSLVVGTGIIGLSAARALRSDSSAALPRTPSAGKCTTESSDRGSRNIVTAPSAGAHAPARRAWRGPRARRRSPAPC